MLKRLLVSCLLSASVFVLSGGSASAAYPEQPIHMIVPWAAGGGTDVVARALAEAMKKYTDVAVVVENVTGAGGSTGNQKVAEAKPDGYTILFNGDTDMLGALSVMKTTYNLDSFRYIGGVYYSPTYILSPKDRNINDINEFIEQAKAHPNKLILGSTTPSGAQIVMCVMLQSTTKAPFRIVPYQGGKDMTKALLGNHCDAGVIHAPVLLPEVRSGLLKVIGTGGSLAQCSYEPLRSMKTLKEQGIPVEMGINRGVMVPAGTPDDVVATLTDIVKKAAESEEFKNFGVRFGFAPLWTPGDAYREGFFRQMKMFEQVKNQSM